MKVIWKRPDGFHGSKPSDYRIVDLQTNSSKIWLHISDRKNFPFRISGGWQEEKASRRLNTLVNLLGDETQEFQDFLQSEFHDSISEDGPQFIADFETWLHSLKDNLKGDTWEIAVMADTLDAVLGKVSVCRVSV